eukprot:g1968.t1
MAPIMRQDIESSGVDGATEPLLPVAMGATPTPEVKTTNCCMIACCAPLAIKNEVLSGGDPPEPDATSSAPVHHHKAWANAFKANVVFTVAAAAWFGGMALEALANDSLTGEGRRRLMHEHHGDHSHHHHHHTHTHGVGDDEGSTHLSNFIVGGVALLGLAAVVSAGMLHSLFHCGRGFLHASYATFVGLFGAIAAVLLLFGAVGVSLFFFVVFAVGLVALRRRKHRIAFGSANLKVASLAIKDMPWTYRSAILMGMVQFLWCVVAAIAALGSFVALETVTAPDGTSHPAIMCLDNFEFDESADVISAGSSCTCSGVKISDEECEFSGLGFPLTLVWLCSMAWGCAVIRNVVAATVSGSVASWWFSPEEDTTPVKGAYHRATTTSFGSMCKAAAVQQLFALACQIAQRVLRFVPCATTLFSWANKAANYVLSYTIAFIGIYGLNFNEAGSRVKEMFQRRAVTTLANDIVVEVGLTLLALSATLAYVLLTGMIMFGGIMKVFSDAEESGKDADEMMDSFEFWTVIGPQIFGVVALVFLVSTVLEVVRSGFKAVFVCFVQDPEMLAEKHGHELHAELHSAWQDMHRHNGCRGGAVNSATEGSPVHVHNTVNGTTSA